MALKAGRVGVNPSQVDMAGNVIGGGSSDSYTKAESDAKYATKTQLTANEKEFNFAYDATTQKYGYKAGATGDFHPFEEGGSGGKGWVTPPNLTREGLNIVAAAFEYVDGGYYVDNVENIVYVDLTLQIKTQSSGYDVSGFPVAASGYYSVLVYENGKPFDLRPYIATPYANDTRLQSTTSSASNGKTLRFCGTYPLKED